MATRMFLRILAMALVSTGAGCRFEKSRQYTGEPPTDGPQGFDVQPDVGISGLKTLRIEPEVGMATIKNGVAGTQAFKAIGTFEGKPDEDLTARVRWDTANAGLASIDAAGLATTGRMSGGQVQILASAGPVTAAALLKIKIELQAEAPGGAALPADPAGKLGGPKNDMRNPELLYPNDGVLFPPNLFNVEVHFLPGPENTLFEIAFANEVTDIRVLTRCTTLAEGCLYVPTMDLWSVLAETNRGGKPLTLTIRGTDDAGKAVGQSKAHTLQFSQDVLRGAIYYWTTSNGTGIMRWNFGDAKQTAAELAVGTTLTTGICVGCHALSRDGRKLVMSTGGAGGGLVLLYDVAKKQPIKPFPLMQKAQFLTWNPDGSKFLATAGNFGDRNFVVCDGATGDRMSTVDLGGGQGTHPDWSPDGKRIVYTDAMYQGADHAPHLAGLSYVEATDTGWSKPAPLLPRMAGKNRYYPAVGADNTTLVFNESTCNTGNEHGEECDANWDPTAQLWAMRLPPTSAAPIELKRANAPGVADRGQTLLYNSFPKWSPFVFALSEQRKLLWVTVSSARRYGLRKAMNGLIWMVGVEPEKLAAGEDPSFAAFCLPFQDLATSNHIGQWTSDVPVIP